MGDTTVIKRIGWRRAVVVEFEPGVVCDGEMVVKVKATSARVIRPLRRRWSRAHA